MIPLLGDLDPSRPKVPAIPWLEFQHRRASIQEHEKWCREGKLAGLGIVTGRISNLVVLDFDSEEAFNDFRVQHCDLTETHTVRSAGRGLPHLYFHLPPHLNLPSQKGQGIDLLSDGRYVVAPPTCIAGQAYKLIRGGMPKTLTAYDIRRIQTFVHHYVLSSHSRSLTSPETLRKPSSPVNMSHVPSRKVSPQDLTNMYYHYCQQGGRNDALFRTSLFARDTGWLHGEVLNILVPMHVQTAKGNETPAHRQSEAKSTIASAFSRPARPIKSQAVQKGLIPNSIREALIQQGRTDVVRTLEGLRQAERQPGEVVTAKVATTLLKGIVGRDSVLKALKAVVGNERLFPPPRPPTKTAKAVATENTQTESKECSFEGGKNQYLIKRGRPEHFYTLPTTEELCRILGVEDRGSDPLEQTDLVTAQKIRVALHRELLKRRPGQYARGWLARRLGVSRRTIATYKQLIPVHSRAMFIDTPINWKTIERLPFDEPIQGAVLVTPAGKRYPALRTVASRLLAKGEGICLKQQMPNFYWYGDQEPLLKRLEIQHEVKVQQERIETFIAKRPQPQIDLKPTSTPKPVKPAKARSKPILPSNLRRPLKDAARETQAQHLYTVLNRAGNKQLSLANARRLVVTYDSEAITSALSLLTKRQVITNPVGFIFTLLRSNQKSVNMQ